MIAAVRISPDRVYVAAHKLWPASTMRDDWVWAHGRMIDGAPELTQRLRIGAQWWALGLTYTPGALLDLAAPHMPAWVFGQVDTGLSAIARQHHIAGICIEKARPKHLHFYPREDDASWRPGFVSAKR